MNGPDISTRVTLYAFEVLQFKAVHFTLTVPGRQRALHCFTQYCCTHARCMISSNCLNTFRHQQRLTVHHEGAYMTAFYHQL